MTTTLSILWLFCPHLHTWPMNKQYTPGEQTSTIHQRLVIHHEIRVYLKCSMTFPDKLNMTFSKLWMHMSNVSVFWYVLHNSLFSNKSRPKSYLECVNTHSSGMCLFVYMVTYQWEEDFWHTSPQGSTVFPLTMPISIVCFHGDILNWQESGFVSS